MKFKIFLIIAVSLIVALIPETAHAMFDVADTDKSKQIFIDPLFGPISGGAGNSPLTPVIQAFNLAMLFIGGILVAYTLIAGTMSTAHDGEMLGKRWSSMWVPIRTAVGTAAILPVNAGFCFAQMVVIWLALQGVGLANTLVKEFASNVVSVEFFDPPSSVRPLRQTLETMFIASACHASMKNQSNEANAPMRLKPKALTVATTPPQYEAVDSNPINSHVIGIVGQVIYGSSGDCGSIYIRGGSGAAGFGNPNASMGGVHGNAFFDVDQYRDDLNQIHIQNVQAAVPMMYELAEYAISVEEGADNYDEMATKVTSVLDGLAKHWNHTLIEKAKSTMAANTNDDFIDSIIEDGWLLLGAWYIEIAKVQDAIVQGVTSVPAGSYGSFAIEDEANDSYVTSAAKGAWRWLRGKSLGIDMNAISEDTAKARALALAGVSGGPGGSVEDFESTSTRSWTAKVVSWFINADVSIAGEQIGGNSNQNPILMARNLGQNMTMIGWTGYFTAAAVLSIFGATGAAATLSPMITTIAGMIIVSGATLSTYIPMLPFVLWVGVALSWAIFLLESMFAAPLWAVTHLAPDGDGVVGRGGQGYMLVLSLVLRPGLAVLGFVSAVILMNPIGTLINATFVGAFLSGVNPSVFGLSQMIMGSVLYCVLMISVITKVFSLIHVIPDKILRWIGGGATDIGETAAGIQGETGQKVIVGAQVGQTLGQGMTQGMQNMKANQLQRQTQKEQELSGAEREASAASNDQDSLATSLDQKQEVAEVDNNKESRESLSEARDSAAVSSLQKAKRQAEVASAFAGTSRANRKHRATGQQADRFLEALDKSGIDSNDPQQVRDFMSKHSGKQGNTSWGKTIQNAYSRDQEVGMRLDELRAYDSIDRQRGSDDSGDDSWDSDDDSKRSF